jgi:hypothetical protein
MTIVS